MVLDISDVAEGRDVEHVAEGNWNARYPGGDNQDNYDGDLYAHSMGVHR